MLRRRVRESFLGDESPDLTPLIDCVFQLLIFFMVTTTFLHLKGLIVDLPSQSEAAEEEKKDINVIVDARGRVEIGGELVDKGRLTERIARAMKENNNDNIVIQADRACIQEYVIEVVDAAKMAGVQGVAFVRLEEEEGR